MAIGEVSNDATPAVAGDNTATTGGPIGNRPKKNCAGVFGHSKVGYGVVGVADNVALYAGVYGEGVHGVTGVSNNGTGVEGYGNGPNGVGVFGQGGDNVPAIIGNTISPTQAGVQGQNNRNGPGVVGKSQLGTGVVGTGGAFAAEFIGKVRVQGDITVSGDIILIGATAAEPPRKGVSGRSAPQLRSVAQKTKRKKAVADISLAQKLADIDARTQRIESVLDSLVRMAGRLPDGRTLVNVIANIERKVNQL